MKILDILDDKLKFPYFLYFDKKIEILNELEISIIEGKQDSLFYRSKSILMLYYKDIIYLNIEYNYASLNRNELDTIIENANIRNTIIVDDFTMEQKINEIIKDYLISKIKKFKGVKNYGR